MGELTTTICFYLLKTDVLFQQKLLKLINIYPGVSPHSALNKTLYPEPVNTFIIISLIGVKESTSSETINFDV